MAMHGAVSAGNVLVAAGADECWDSRSWYVPVKAEMSVSGTIGEFWDSRETARAIMVLREDARNLRKAA